MTKLVIAACCAGFVAGATVGFFAMLAIGALPEAKERR